MINPEKFEKREENNKEEIWQEKELETNKIADSLGKEIDPRIKKTVTAFRVYEFPTSGSCEGHLEKGKGNPYPWVEIYSPDPEGWKDNEEIQKEWRIKNLKEQKRMTELLAEFYKERDTPFDERLSFRFIGAFGGFRVQSFSAEQMPLFSKKEQKEKITKYRKEMDDFAEFLKEKYFEE